MFQVIFFITVVLLIIFIIALITLGMCIGMAHLMTYFVPTIELFNALVPSAILTTALIVIISYVFIAWFNAAWAKIPNYYDDEEEDPEPLTVTRIHPHRNNRHRR